MRAQMSMYEYINLCFCLAVGLNSLLFPITCTYFSVDFLIPFLIYVSNLSIAFVFTTTFHFQRLYVCWMNIFRCIKIIEYVSTFGYAKYAYWLLTSESCTVWIDSLSSSSSSSATMNKIRIKTWNFRRMTASRCH